jgi:peptidoglycan hydrolase-like protein with peptidoglycan-binding domain
VVANGGSVRQKKYSLSYKLIAGYGRPAYDEPEVAYYKPTVLEWQKAAIADGFKPPKYFPKYGADGVWGAECEAVAKQAVVKKRLVHKYKNLTKLVQKVVGVEADGKCGPETAEAIAVYQTAHGLVADKKAGPNTWKEILKVR